MLQDHVPAQVSSLLGPMFLTKQAQTWPQARGGPSHPLPEIQGCLFAQARRGRKHPAAFAQLQGCFFAQARRGRAAAPMSGVRPERPPLVALMEVAHPWQT